MRMAQDNAYDAIVVGSGIAGGWAAKELTEKGLKRLLVLERGRMVEHIDYPTATKDLWELPYGGRPTDDDLRRQAVAAHTDYMSRRSPSTASSRTPSIRTRRSSGSTGSAAIRSAAGRSCGAGSATAGATSTSRRTRKDGVGIDWPIRYADIAPWYDYVESFIGVSGETRDCRSCPTASSCRRWR